MINMTQEKIQDSNKSWIFIYKLIDDIKNLVKDVN